MENIEIALVDSTIHDLENFFEFQLVKEAQFIAAFTPNDPADYGSYVSKYNKHLADPTIIMKTIKHGDNIIGSIAKFVMDNENEVTYWIDRQYWGKGVASAALRELLSIVEDRPIYGRTVFDNIGSQRVLENCGFVRIGEDQGFANARQGEVKEYIYKLNL